MSSDQVHAKITELVDRHYDAITFDAVVVLVALFISTLVVAL